MTDGRIPGKWISEPRFAEMSVDTWCVLTKAITWSNEAGTDGLIKRRYLSQFHPDGLCPEAYADLTTRGIWTVVADGYQFNDWSKRPHHGGLGQSTAEEVLNRKERSKKTSQAYRAKHKNLPVTDDVTGDGDVSRRKGQERKGHAIEGGDLDTTERTLTWETAVPGRPEQLKSPARAERDAALITWLKTAPA